MIEVERKYRLPSAAAGEMVTRVITNWDTTARQIDTIYLQDAGSFAEVDKQRGYAVLRVRDSNGEATVTAKRRSTTSSAIEAELHTDSQTAASFMDALRWNVVAHVAKTRSQATLNGVTVALDDVDNLGLFVELEVIIDSESETDGALDLIDSVARSLQLRSEWIETKKYDELVSPVK